MITPMWDEYNEQRLDSPRLEELMEAAIVPFAELVTNSAYDELCSGNIDHDRFLQIHSDIEKWIRLTANLLEYLASIPLEFDLGQTPGARKY